MEGERPLIVCLTPVKDEAWILPRFLRCAASWADHVIVADQGSIDGSRAIVQNCAKAKLINNPLDRYDEGARQRLLVDAARSMPSTGKLTMIALDADEALSANWRNSPEWDKLIGAAPGTVLAFQWVNLLPGCLRGWLSDEPIPFGFVDDGTLHQGESIHSQRLPTPEGAPWMVFEDIKVLHYQYIDWPRMKSKQRWYQCWERINNPGKRAVTIFRQYNFMDAKAKTAAPVDSAWIENTDASISAEEETGGGRWYRWDSDVLDLFAQYGTGPFRRLAIWDTDWVALAKVEGRPDAEAFADPRTNLDKRIHRWLAATQPWSLYTGVRAAQQVIRMWGW